MFWIIKKELLMNLRYKMRTFNRYFFPFFLIAPYILVSEFFQMEGNILKNMIQWIWMCQLLFGISDGISELKLEGTFTNILMAPCSMFEYLFYKYLYHVIDCCFITIVTQILCVVFLGVYVEQFILFLIITILFSFCVFSFSILFGALVLRYKRVRELNYFLQQIFGFLSGYTNDIYSFPQILRLFSYLIPLTYSILLLNHTFKSAYVFGICALLTIIYLGIGNSFLNKEVNNMRKRGDSEQW